MTATTGGRSRRIAATANVLAAITVCTGVLTLVLSTSLPEAWWPSTGQAFTPDARPTAHQDPCATIVGQAKAYCERGTTASAGRHDASGAAWWRLTLAGAGLAALVLWRGRNAAQRRRR
ncbi:hypothetical protein DKG34_37840 [Streptomyces sp. NWU49]|uniref:hypothetical protein n=1 Tax=Streptomyces sp. NWU49 TaxID=2201153 RepID=UPI000D672B2B|nr:hypothetical protein [Streptomyces sp. NWU49]PWJ02568.1 hypothetical protein DKG34_37840 [Streptomyces sp. NWU49]